MTISTREPPAPAFEAGAVGLPWYRRAWHQGAGYLLPNLIFLALPATFVHGEVSTARYVGLLAVLALLGGLLVGTSVVAHWGESGRWVWIGLIMGSLGLLAYFGDNLSLMAYFTPYVTVATAMLIPWRAARTVMLGVSTIGIGIAFYEAELLAGVLSATGLIVGFSIGQGLRTAAMERQLQEAEERTAVLAVAAERERIGRDLHDILGHSLTTIAIKADLASRLAERDIGAARSEIDDVAAVARQALADVRATASGMREVRLAAEIASARSVLGAAAIRAETPSALPVLDDETSELMGYVVREAVTNVLRHSGASRCRIVVDEDSVEISDDGAGFPAGTLRSGLRGLDDRLREAGWRLTITSDDGVTVRAEKGRDVS